MKIYRYIFKEIHRFFNNNPAFYILLYFLISLFVYINYTIPFISLILLFISFTLIIYKIYIDRVISKSFYDKNNSYYLTINQSFISKVLIDLSIPIVIIAIAFSIFETHNYIDRNYLFDSSNRFIVLEKPHFTKYNRINLLIKSEHKYILSLNNNQNTRTIEIGDTILLKNNIYRIKEGNNYLRSQNIKSLIFAKDFTIIKFNTFHNNIYLSNLAFAKIRSNIMEIISKMKISNDAKSILSAIIVANSNDENLKDIKSNFSIIGASHLLVVSGFHIAVIYIFLISFFKFIFIRLRLSFLYNNIIITVIILSIIWSYVAITNFGDSSIRAAFFISLHILSRFFNRGYSSFNTLSLVALIQIIYNPFIIYSLSFILSYTATASIILFYKSIYNLFSDARLVILKYIWQLLALSISAQILIAPVLLYYFGYFSFAFIWTTIVLSIIFSILSILSIFMIILNSIEFVSNILFFIFDNLVSISINYVKIFSSFDFLRIEYKLGTYPFILSYISLLIIGVAIYQRNKSSVITNKYRKLNSIAF